ncbi:serine/threonine-protein kinase [Nocardia sp. NPDC052566]|uniref:serine/threonine-protein kinase n=1 Tax=Nocardia sp. NPDC052566 TaxID=3364330 RepID=UPI0037C79632
MLNGGDVFAGYHIERLIGQGGMGSVYLARHPRLPRRTALKLLNRELFSDNESRARFAREADLSVGLDGHSNIVTVYDRGAEADHLWISMQYIDGVDASQIDPLALSPSDAVAIIELVAAALDFAHEHGVLHRDVKPANILLEHPVSGRPRGVFLTDFGIARLREDIARLTQTGTFTATLAFASPEQMTGGPTGPTSDQYSLACTLFWLCCGGGPFDATHPGEVVRGHLQLEPPSVRTKRPGLPATLDAVFARALAKRPQERFSSCGEFAAAARQALRMNPELSPEPLIVARSAPTMRRIPSPIEAAPEHPHRVAECSSATEPPAGVRDWSPASSVKFRPSWWRGRRVTGLVGGGALALVALIAVAAARLNGPTPYQSDVSAPATVAELTTVIDGALDVSVPLTDKGKFVHGADKDTELARRFPGLFNPNNAKVRVLDAKTMGGSVEAHLTLTPPGGQPKQVVLWFRGYGHHWKISDEWICERLWERSETSPGCAYLEKYRRVPPSR